MSKNKTAAKINVTTAKSAVAFLASQGYETALSKPWTTKKGEYVCNLWVKSKNGKPLAHNDKTLNSAGFVYCKKSNDKNRRHKGEFFLRVVA